MSKCFVCQKEEIPSEQTVCLSCLKKISEKVYEKWKQYAAELKEQRLFDLRKCVDETAQELANLEKEKGKIIVPFEDFFELKEYKLSKWITVPDFMDDVINICPTCGKEFSMPDGTGVAYYFKYCPFCGDKIED